MFSVSDMKLFSGARLCCPYVRHIDQLISELRLYGRSSDIVWTRVVDYMDLIQDDLDMLASIMNMIVEALEFSGSNYEKAEKYLCLATLNFHDDNIFHSLLEKAYHSALFIDNPEEKMLIMSRIAKMAFITNNYRLGRVLIENILAIGKSLGPSSLINAHIYVGWALYGWDFGESDTYFLKCRDIISMLPSKYQQAVFLMKLAAYYRDTFRDEVSKDTSEEWFNESLAYLREFEYSLEEYIADVLAYIYKYDELLGDKYLDIFLANLFSKKNWMQLLKRCIVGLGSMEEYLEPLDNIERWLSTIYVEGKISDEVYAGIHSYIISATARIDPYSALYFLRSRDNILLHIVPEKLSLAIEILENIGSLDIPLTYNLVRGLLEKIVLLGDIRDAILLLSRTQKFFPNKTESLYRGLIKPKIKNINMTRILNIIDLLAKINVKSVDTLIRKIISEAEKMGPMLRAKIIGKIGVGLVNRNYSWSLQLLDYLDEILQDFPESAKAEIYADIGIELYKRKKHLGIEVIKRCVSIVDSLDPKKALEILTRILESIDDNTIALWTRQLEQYAAELKATISYAHMLHHKQSEMQDCLDFRHDR